MTKQFETGDSSNVSIDDNIVRITCSVCANVPNERLVRMERGGRIYLKCEHMKDTEVTQVNVPHMDKGSMSASVHGKELMFGSTG